MEIPGCSIIDGWHSLRSMCRQAAETKDISHEITMQHLNSKQLSKTVSVCVQCRVKGGGRERNDFVFGLNSYHVFGGTVTRLRVKTETKEQLK